MVPCHSAGPRPWGTDRGRHSLAPRLQPQAAHKSGRETVRVRKLLLAAEAVEVVEVAVEVAASVWGEKEGPCGLAKRAGAAAASPGTG